MLELIVGGSGSGKSEIAENRAVGLYRSFCLQSSGMIPGKNGLIYLATMVNSGEEAESRIRRHRERRKEKGFITLERSYDIGELPGLMEERGDFPPGKECTVLLEALSDLLANEMFGCPGDCGASDGFSFDPTAYERVLKDIEKLNFCFGNLVIVSDDVFRDGIDYKDESSMYLKGLASLHRGIAAMADRVIEVAAGCGIVWKGINKYDIDYRREISGKA